VQCEVKCGVWWGKCGVWRGECAVWSLEFGAWSEVWSVKCGVCSVKCEVWSGKCVHGLIDFCVWSVVTSTWRNLVIFFGQFQNMNVFCDSANLFDHHSACAKPVGICFVVVTQSDVASFTCRIVEGECIILSGYSSVRCFELYDFTIAQLLQGKKVRSCLWLHFSATC